MATKSIMREPGRRSFAEIARLPHEAVKEQLLAVGLKPLELVPYIENYGVGPNPNPKLEAHQRHDFSECDQHHADDPFFIEWQKNHKPVPSIYDAVTMDHYWLYGYELDRYIEAFPFNTILKKLAAMTPVQRAWRTPQRDWSEDDFRRELYSRLNYLDREEFENGTRLDAVKEKPTKPRTKHPQPPSTKETKIRNDIQT